MEQSLIIIGSSIFGLLGFAHLLLTFFTNKFEAHDATLTASMKNNTIKLTKETTVWKAWIGFNASHSMGAILIALIFIPLTLQYTSIIANSYYFLFVLAFYSTAYLWLAIKYWFKLPLIGIGVASACFWGTLVLKII